ncbi:MULTISPECIES: sigma-70 family RNA polymerase sigma factor [Paenibacillus]|uniref:sigma-70 family RNA polymerase sigma factor n=1 Tax=Paenibacillus TaxID=44249 RepID=UPI0022B8AAFA|nr:sigma-70 family RNA polymerase sigma factor [Paenibacillus caseinilyticus]MCZ8523620.1 sigma-70 family RNA polymerase sigma factor [Paenibacillus caseinilyticus]
MDLDRLYRTYRPLLFTTAYRMLGSAAEAEDAVHDLFAALGTSGADGESLRSEQAYLLKLLTNRCLNVLKSARRRRETYPGPWLPEPLFEAVAAGDPLRHVLDQEAFTYAFLVLLEELSPPERTVFVLRETLDLGYGELAELTGRTESGCRQLYSRARRKLEAAAELSGPSQASPQAEALATAFLGAAATGRYDTLLGLLSEDAVLVSDGGGKVRAAFLPILGAGRVRAFFEGIARKGSLAGEFIPARLSGQPGLLLLQEGRVRFAFTVVPDAGGSGIRRIYMISNPDKLAGAAVIGREPDTGPSAVLFP